MCIFLYNILETSIEDVLYIYIMLNSGIQQPLGAATAMHWMSDRRVHVPAINRLLPNRLSIDCRLLTVLCLYR